MASKKDVPGSKSARKSAERPEPDNDEDKAAYARLKRDSDAVAVGLVTAVDNILMINRALERSAERIARREADPEAREAWGTRHARLRRVNDDKHRRTITTLIEILSGVLVTGRTDRDFQKLAEFFEEEVLTVQWLEACAAIRQMYAEEQKRREARKRNPQLPDKGAVTDSPAGMHVRWLDLLVAVDENAVKLTDDGIFEALRDKRIKAPNGEPVELAKFAARLAARCGALGNEPERKLYDRFTKHRR